jgi:hypothetical protein
MEKLNSKFSCDYLFTVPCQSRLGRAYQRICVSIQIGSISELGFLADQGRLNESGTERQFNRWCTPLCSEQKKVLGSVVDPDPKLFTN